MLLGCCGSQIETMEGLFLEHKNKQKSINGQIRILSYKYLYILYKIKHQLHRSQFTKIQPQPIYTLNHSNFLKCFNFIHNLNQWLPDHLMIKYRYLYLKSPIFLFLFLDEWPYFHLMLFFGFKVGSFLGNLGEF